MDHNIENNPIILDSVCKRPHTFTFYKNWGLNINNSKTFSLVENGELVQNPLENQIAAVSVGIVDGEYIVDLDYENDSQAEVDLNLVLNDKYEILEIQGTAEKKPFSKEDLDKLFELTKDQIDEIFEVQKN